MDGSSQKGFTLVEVVVASTILVIFMAGLYQVIAFGLSMWDKGEGRIDEQQNVRIAANHIVRELRTAYSFDIGPAGVAEEPRNSIQMTLPDPSLTPVNYPKIRYYFDGGNEIQRSVDGAGNNIVAYGIKSIQFTSNPEKNSIIIEIEGNGGYKLKTQVFIRALNVSFVDTPGAFARGVIPCDAV